MKSLIALSAAVALIALSAYARLGEKPAEIAKRYGEPITAPHDIGTNEYMLRYTHGDYDIAVNFWNGKDAEEIIYSKTVLDEDAAKTIFATISGKEQPQVVKKDDLETIFTEGDVIGFFSPSLTTNYNYTVSVTTEEYHRHFQDEVAEGIKKSKESEKKKIQDNF